MKSDTLFHVNDETALKPRDTVEDYTYSAADVNQQIIKIGPQVND